MLCSALLHPAHQNQIKERGDLRRNSYTRASYSIPKLFTPRNSNASLPTSRTVPDIPVTNKISGRSAQILEKSKLDHAGKYSDNIGNFTEFSVTLNL